MDAPVDRVKVAELATRWGALGFLFPKPLVPIFGNDHVAVTRKAADHLADCFNLMVHLSRPGGPVDRPMAQRFILQMLVALFAEDIGMLPRYLVDHLLEGCKTKQDSRDLIGGLFEAMNTREKTADDRYQGVDYFNGGLFAEPARVELRIDEVGLLKAASHEDWSKVRPEIFGTLFQHSLGKVERRAFGAHFTHPTDIMKIVGPTIVEPWRKLIEEADTLKRLNQLWQRMHDFIVLDPACGSGNFLYIAYRELKRLEARLFERMAEKSGRLDPSQMMFGFVSARQFFGIDINPFAVELAKVTMMIARKLAIDELHITEKALPLDNLDDNFAGADALIDELGNPVEWPTADVIIGNPPFAGAKLLKPERGPDYVNAVRRAYPEIPGMADYCVYWFRKAHDHLRACTTEDPVAGRAGLVGTQNIRNNQSRVGGLDYVVQTGTITEAVDNQPWSGEANVHVSIANWVKTKNPALLPPVRKLWFKVDAARAPSKLRSRGSDPATKEYELDVKTCDFINSALSMATDVSQAKTLKCNVSPQRCFQGVIAGYEGFVLSPDEAIALINEDTLSASCIHPFLIGRDLLTGTGKPTRWVIDLSGKDLLCAHTYKAIFNHIKCKVLPFIEEKAKPGVSHDAGREGHLDKWWEMWRPRPEMVGVLSRLTRYIACSDTTKRPVFVFIHPEIRPDHKIRAFAFEDDYSFGILQSHSHWLWFITKCSKLTERFNYTSSSVFDPYPWPQSPSSAKIDAVADAGRHVRRIRSGALSKVKGGCDRFTEPSNCLARMR